MGSADCPDNTAHIVLERIAGELPIPGLYIAEVVCSEVVDRGWKHVPDANSQLPVVDSTRLPAEYGVRVALAERSCGIRSGWLETASLRDPAGV